MRTRILPRMLNDEVEEYLSRNDIIIVPVGTVEMHGGECAGRNRLFDGGGKQPVAPGIQTPDLHQFSRPGTYDMQSDGAGFL